MKRKSAFALVGCLGCSIVSVAMAQDVSPLAFDVASVKPDRRGPGDRDVDHDGGLLTMTNVSLKRCIMLAYGVGDDRVFGPAWIDSEAYDISAKVLSGGVDTQYTLRLQTLLKDRFKLVLHREMREGPVFDLVVAKNGPKIRPDAPAASLDSDSTRTKGHATFRAVSMDKLARFLERPQMAVDRPVVDKTGLSGTYSFTLDWTLPDRAGGADSPKGDDQWPSIFGALQEQLGLKLEPGRARREVLVVDSAEKVPTEN